MLILLYVLIVLFLGGCDSDTTTTTTPSTTTTTMNTQTFLSNYNSLHLIGPGSVDIKVGNSTRLELQYPVGGNVTWNQTSSVLTVTNKCTADDSVCQSATGSAGFVLSGTVNYKNFSIVKASHYIDMVMADPDSPARIPDLHFDLSKGSVFKAQGSAIRASNSTRFTLSYGSGVEGSTQVNSPYVEVIADEGDSNYFGQGDLLSKTVVITGNTKTYMQIGGSKATTSVTFGGEAVFNAQNCKDCNMFYDLVKSIGGTVGTTTVSQMCPTNFTQSYLEASGTGTALTLHVDNCY